MSKSHFHIDENSKGRVFGDIDFVSMSSGSILVGEDVNVELIRTYGNCTINLFGSVDKIEVVEGTCQISVPNIRLIEVKKNGTAFLDGPCFRKLSHRHRWPIAKAKGFKCHVEYPFPLIIGEGTAIFREYHFHESWTDHQLTLDQLDEKVPPWERPS